MYCVLRTPVNDALWVKVRRTENEHRRIHGGCECKADARFSGVEPNSLIRCRSVGSHHRSRAHESALQHEVCGADSCTYVCAEQFDPHGGSELVVGVRESRDESIDDARPVWLDKSHLNQVRAQHQAEEDAHESLDTTHAE